MRGALSDSYLMSLLCLTAVVIVSLELSALMDFLLYVVTLVIIVRVILPKYRKSVLYRVLVLFDWTTFAQTVRKKMNNIGKARKVAIIMGTLFYFVFILGITMVVTSSHSLTNLNGTTTFIPPMYQEITPAPLFLLCIFGLFLGYSCILMAFGYYGKFNNWNTLRRAFLDLVKNAQLHSAS